MDKIFKSNSTFIKTYFEDLESNPYLPVFWIDALGKIFHVNDAVCRYLGYSNEELTGKYVWEIDPTANRDNVLGLIDIIRKYKINRFESQHRAKDGRLLDVEVISNYYCIEGVEFSFNYVFDNSEKKQKERALVRSNAELEELSGRLENMVAEKTKELSRKIEELEVSEESARRSEELFIKAFKTSQDSINLNSLEDGTYIMVNEGFTQIMGYTGEDVLGKSSVELGIWKNPDDRLRLVEAIKRDGYCHNLMADFVRKDGGIVHGLMSASIHDYRGRKVLLNVSKDITKMKKLENELKELNAQLQNRVEEEVAVIRRQQEIIFEQKKLADMGMMINAIAHQWRQPLNIIGLRTQEIADNYRDGGLTDEYICEFEKNQMDTVEYLSSTIEDFRTFFKPDDKESEFDAGGVVISLLKLVEVQMLAKGIKAYVSYCDDSSDLYMEGIGEFPEKMPGRTLVKGFKGEFNQVMTNLIYNSIFAIEEGRGTAGGKNFIHVKIDKTDGRVVIKIEDSGGGIAENVKPYVFNPYFTTKTGGKGTGLGLYLAKLIIQTHMNGTITVDNTENGAEFTIILPSACI